MPPPPTYSLRARGTLTFTPHDPVRPPGRYVIQTVAPGLGNVASDPARATQIRAHVIPADPRTPAQLARRAALADAVNQWQALDPATRDYWTQVGAARRLPGYNAFLSAALSAT